MSSDLKSADLADLCESGVSSCADFPHRLIEVTAARGEHGGETGYYERWFQALERLTLENGLVTPAELDARTAALTSDEHDQHDAH